MNDSPGSASPGSADEPEQAGRGNAGTDQQSPPQWSTVQPPRGQWAPTDRPGMPGPAGGWGGGWGAPGQPPAPQPGVVPLRPLSVSEILGGTVTTLRRNWRAALGISFLVALVTQALSTAADGLLPRGLSGLGSLGADAQGASPELTELFGGSPAAGGVTLLIGLLGTILVSAVLTVIVSRAVLGRGISAGEAWRGARPHLPRLAGLLLLVPLLLLGVLAACATPGLVLMAAGSTAGGRSLLMLGLLGGMTTALWIWIRFCLAAPALVLEKQGVVAALRRSVKLVRGAWWRVCGIQLLTQILLMFAALLIQIPTGAIAVSLGGEQSMNWLTDPSAPVSWPFLITTGVGAMLAATLSFPVSAGVTALLYMDQRIRRESLDLELARAAGVPGYGPTPEAPTTGAATAGD